MVFIAIRLHVVILLFSFVFSLSTNCYMVHVMSHFTKTLVAGIHYCRRARMVIPKSLTLGPTAV